MALLKLCSKCGVRVVPATQKRCDECQDRHIDSQKARNKVYDKTKRNGLSSSFYNTKGWKTVVASVSRRDHYLCRLCFSKKKIKPKKLAHHIVEVLDGEEGWNKRLDDTNCISLCAKCHGLVHAEYEKNESSKMKMQKILQDIVGGGFETF